MRSYTVRREQIQRATTSQWALDTRRGLLLGRTEGPCQTHSLTENVKAFMTEDVLEASFFASCTPRRPSDQSAIYGAIRPICYSRGDRGSPTFVRHRILLRSSHVPSSCSPTRLLLCLFSHLPPRHRTMPYYIFRELGLVQPRGQCRDLEEPAVGHVPCEVAVDWGPSRPRSARGSRHEDRERYARAQYPGISATKRMTA